MVKDYSTHLLISYLLWFFLGFWGAHRFFNGRWVSGIFYILTGAFCGIGWIIDLFILPRIVRETLEG